MYALVMAAVPIAVGLAIALCVALWAASKAIGEWISQSPLARSVPARAVLRVLTASWPVAIGTIAVLVVAQAMVAHRARDGEQATPPEVTAEGREAVWESRMVEVILAGQEQAGCSVLRGHLERGVDEQMNEGNRREGAIEIVRELYGDESDDYLLGLLEHCRDVAANWGVIRGYSESMDQETARKAIAEAVKRWKSVALDGEH